MTSRDRIAGRLTAILLLTALLAAAPVLAAALRFQPTDAPAGSAVLEVQGEELVTMTVLPFRLLLNDEAGHPIAGARVSCELSMPSMSMPENRPKVIERDGAYTGEMVLTCTMGDWRMTCSAEGERGRQRTVTFDLGRARMK